jgi:type I restriction enzyme S subunit
MKKYDNYKDSGIEWIGEIPNHWDVTRIKYKFQIGRGRVISNEDLVEDAIYPVYSSQTLNNGCLGYIDTYDFDDKLITWTTDGANAGTVFLREGKFNCTNVCGTLKAKSDEIIAEFDYYFLQYATQFYKRPDTNGAKIMNNEMAVILSLKLPKDEQTAIANYLDHKTTQIDNLISKKEQFIQLLEEERIAVINQAVTKGLDPNVPIKESGIEWLGEIPEHWEVKKLKYVANLKSGENITSEKIKEQGDYPVYGGNGLRGYFPEYTNEGDYILIGRQGALCGNIKYAKNRFWASEHAIVCYLEPNINWLWFGKLLESMNLNQYNQSAAQPGLAVGVIKNLSIPYPKSEQQNEIVEFIIDYEKRTDELIEKTSNEIGLLKEYKTALISEVVTGKVDVRNEKLN